MVGSYVGIGMDVLFVVFVVKYVMVGSNVTEAICVFVLFVVVVVMVWLHVAVGMNGGVCGHEKCD